MANGSPNLDLAMRIGLEMDDAVQQAAQLDTALDKVQGAGKNAGKGLDAAATAANRESTAVKAAATAAGAKSTANAKLKASEDAAAKSIDRATISAKQQAQAMHQLPMQMTDIVTGLASGQSPFMVLIQQGGQLKDSFGGVVPAARAVLGAISPLAVGIGATALVAGALAKAMYDGYMEMERFERVTITTGDAAGVTGSRFVDMASDIDQATLAFGKGREAMYLLLQSGTATVDVLEQAAQAAVALSELTGESIEDTTATIQKLMAEPAKYSAELNRQYNYLEAEIYAQIVALERQGRTQDAVRLAVESFSTTATQRLADVTASLGYLEKGWYYVKVGAKAAWDEMLGLGRQDTLSDQRKAVQQQMVVLDRQIEVLRRGNANAAAIKRVEDARLAAMEQFKQLSIQMGQEEAAAESKREDAEKNRRSIEAQGRAEAWRAQDRAIAKAQELKQLEKDIAAARASGLKELGGFSLDEYNTKRTADIEEKYKAPKKPKGPKAPKTEAEQDEEAAKRELENLQKQISLLGSLEEGETKASEAARIRYEIEEGAYKLASPALKQQLQDQAKLLDTERMRQDAAKKMVDVQLEIARLQGRGEDGELAKARTELNRLIADLNALGKTKEAADVAKLLNLKEATSDLSTLRARYDQVMGEIALEQQRIQVETQVGLLTEGEAQQKIVDLYKSKLGTLKALVPEMRAAALALGGPAGQAALANVEALELKLREMEATTNLLAQAVRETLHDSFKDLFADLADTSSSILDDLKAFIGNIAQGMFDFATEQLSQGITNMLMEKFGTKLLSNAADAATETAGAAATTAAATALTAAGTTVTAGATAVGTSAATLGASGATLVTGAAALSGAAIQLQAAAAALTVANSIGAGSGFAMGGWTGHGGKYEVAGLVHRGEGVLSQEDIAALGGPAGFFALRRAIHNGFAAGGMALDRPALSSSPTYRMQASPVSTNVLNRLRQYFLFDIDDLAQRVASHPANEKAIVTVVGQNGQTIRSEWQ